MGKLKNERQEMFCQYYITEIDGKIYNATKAAQKAGYSMKTAYSQGHRLTQMPYIQERIEELKADALASIGMDQLYYLTKIKKIIEDDIRNYLSFRMSETAEELMNGDIHIEIKNSADIDTWNVSEIKKGKDGQFTFKLHDKQKALSDLREYMKIGTAEKGEESEEIIDNFTPVLGMIEVAIKEKLNG